MTLPVKPSRTRAPVRNAFVIEEYFYREDQPTVPDIAVKPVVINDLAEIFPSDGGHLNTKAQKAYACLTESVLIREYEATLGSFAFNCAILNKVKDLIEVNETDIVRFEMWDGPTREPYAE